VRHYHLPTKTNEPEGVGLSISRKTKVDVDELAEEVGEGVIAELAAYHCCEVFRMHLTGMEGEGPKETAEDAGVEERTHFAIMTPRANELGGGLTSDAGALSHGGRPDSLLPKEPRDPSQVLLPFVHYPTIERSLCR